MSYKDRKKPRAIVRYSAKINFEETSANCMIVDMSVTGARIHLSEKDELPQRFLLLISVIPEAPPVLVKARRVWRQRNLAGLHFEELNRKDYLILDALIKIHRAEIMQTGT